MQADGLEEFFGPTIDVNARSLEDPEGAVRGEVQCFAGGQSAGLLLVVAGGRERQAILGQERHVPNDVHRLPIFGIVGLRDGRIDRHSCGDLWDIAPFYPAPKALNEGAGFEFRGAQKVLVAVIHEGLTTAARPVCVGPKRVEIVGQVDVWFFPTQYFPQAPLKFQIKERPSVKKTGEAFRAVGTRKRGGIGVVPA